MSTWRKGKRTGWLALQCGRNGRKQKDVNLDNCWMTGLIRANFARCNSSLSDLLIHVHESLLTGHIFKWGYARNETSCSIDFGIANSPDQHIHSLEKIRKRRRSLRCSPESVGTWTCYVSRTGFSGFSL